MGYFPNSTAFDYYYNEYCSKCVHWVEEEEQSGCPIIDAHWLYNYDDCNNPESILHILIPRDKEEIHNQRCAMFIKKLYKKE